MLADRANYRYVYEQSVDWKEISTLSREHENTLFLRGLNADERRAYDLVAKYQRSRIDAARAWTTYFDLKTKGRDNLDYALKIAREFNERRNQLAYELVVNKESTARFVEKTSIALSDIQKQAKQHHAHLHQWRQKYLKPETRETVKRIIVDVAHDETTPITKFNGLIDEWKRVEKHHYSALRALAEHNETLSNPRYSENVKALAQKAYDRELEVVYQDEDYLNALKKIAPGVAKIIIAQGEKIPGLKVDWLSPKLNSEWKALSQSNNKKIKELIDERELFKNTANVKMKEIYLVSLNRKIGDFMSDKNSFTELLNKAPNLGKQMLEYHDRAKERDRGISR